MPRIILASLLFAGLAFASSALFGEGLTIKGGKDKSQKNFEQVEREVDAGRDQRDANALAPLMPIINWVVEGLREGQAFLNAKAESGTRAILTCDDKPTAVSVPCSTSQTNQQCIDAVEYLVRDMGYDDTYDYCKIPNPEAHKLFQPDSYSRHTLVKIAYD
jgi:hypothetical protein